MAFHDDCQLSYNGISTCYAGSQQPPQSCNKHLHFPLSELEKRQYSALPSKPHHVPQLFHVSSPLTAALHEGIVHHSSSRYPGFVKQQGSTHSTAAPSAPSAAMAEFGYSPMSPVESSRLSDNLMNGSHTFTGGRRPDEMPGPLGAFTEPSGLPCRVGNPAGQQQGGDTLKFRLHALVSWRVRY